MRCACMYFVQVLQAVKTPSAENRWKSRHISLAQLAMASGCVGAIVAGVLAG